MTKMTDEEFQEKAIEWALRLGQVVTEMCDTTDEDGKPIVLSEYDQKALVSTYFNVIENMKKDRRGGLIILAS